jgi:hypothetical protein
LSVAGEITFFKGVYRRHTNFAKESVNMAFNQTPAWGQQTTCVISRTGDLLSKVWLNVRIPKLNEPLTKGQFFELKKQLLGDVPLLDTTGLPEPATGAQLEDGIDFSRAAPSGKEYPEYQLAAETTMTFDDTKSLHNNLAVKYNLAWTYEMNTSYYLPVPFDTTISPDNWKPGDALKVGDYYTSIPKSMAAAMKLTTLPGTASAPFSNIVLDTTLPSNTAGMLYGRYLTRFTDLVIVDPNNNTHGIINDNRTSYSWPKWTAFFDLVTTTDSVAGAAVYQKPFVWNHGPLDAKTFDQSMELQKEYIQSNPGKFPKARYCDEVGHAMIEKIDLVIGGTLIDSHPGHYLHVWNELTQTPEKKQIGHLIGRSGSEAELEDMAMEDQDLYIPLQFFFCRHLMCSLPLIALQYHQVEIKVTFKNLSQVVAFAGYQIGTKASSTFEIKKALPINVELGHTASFYQHMEASKGLFVDLRSKENMQSDTEYAIRSAQLMCNLVYLEEENVRLSRVLHTNTSLTYFSSRGHSQRKASKLLTMLTSTILRANLFGSSYPGYLKLTENHSITLPFSPRITQPAIH